MKVSKEAKKLAIDLGLSMAEAFVMDLKSNLYVKASTAIKSSGLDHEAIAKLVGTSRSRINRIANNGENSLSIEFLLKLIASLENKVPVKIIAA